MYGTGMELKIAVLEDGQKRTAVICPNSSHALSHTESVCMCARMRVCVCPRAC